MSSVIAMADPAVAETPTPPLRRRRGRRLIPWTFRALVVCLVGFNAWWVIREARPVSGLDAIGRMISRGEYDQSDRALGEWLRRSPQYGEARMLLARSLAARGD